MKLFTPGAAMLLSIALALPVAAGTVSPTGKWRTFDPETGALKNIVEIAEANGTMEGTIVELLDKSETVCTNCKGERKSQPLVGMVILWGLTPDGDAWSGGTILRPANGMTANAKIELQDGGRKLEMTGSRGFMSRSQTWERVE
ncbi:MAG: DUF2147 domain-containing protein [Alphaproteobacteria bacterium HGW-Alphaproteobacteria-12]|nr:MAG: DUF2147 domain-containing protein [Alphaproteobacteria bacterium HGW-Alphaproteobacteria-12]